MKRGVRSPGPPRFGNLKDSLRVVFSERLSRAQIGMRKSVRPRQGTHRNVLRGPFTDARDLAQAVEGSFNPVARRENQFATVGRLGQGNERLGAPAGDTEFSDFNRL